MIDDVFCVPEWGIHPVMTTSVSPVAEPLTIDEAKLAAGLDWPAGDPRDAQMQGFLSTARRVVEAEGSLALLTQTRVIGYDAVPPVLQLPVRPLQSVAVAVTHSDATIETLDPSTYLVDRAGGRVAFLSWPSDVQALQGWQVTAVAGWTTPAALPRDLVHVVGLLCAHFATLGRDLALLDAPMLVPYGAEALLAPWRLLVLV